VVQQYCYIVTLVQILAHASILRHAASGGENNNPPAEPGVFRIAAPSKGAHRNPTSKAHSEQAWAIVKRDCQGQNQILFV
jgi:hypothetical protein